jgi:hypothetical protein
MKHSHDNDSAFVLQEQDLVGEAPDNCTTKIFIHHRVLFRMSYDRVEAGGGMAARLWDYRAREAAQESAGMMYVGAGPSVPTSRAPTAGRLYRLKNHH